MASTSRADTTPTRPRADHGLPMAHDHVHPRRTEPGGLEYLFYAKHHGAGSRSDACWAADVTEGEEFWVFEAALQYSVADGRGWFYGVLPTPTGLRDLGTWQQQIAAFPATLPPHPWHGFPAWAVDQAGPSNRRGERMRPSKIVFDLLESSRLITAVQRRRLFKGDHV